MMRPLLFAFGIAALATAASAAEPAAADQRALARLAQRMDEAWTAGDANANAELFATDATARFGGDPIGQGRNAIRAQFLGFFKDRPAGLRHVTRIEQMEKLAPNLVQWDAEVRVERQQADHSWKALTVIRNITIAVRQRDGWRIRTVRAFPLNP